MAKHTLLLVDPDDHSLNVMEVSLRNFGYQVYSVTDAEQAWPVIRMTPPDLIISEIRLAGQSGLEFCQQIKSEAQTKKIPFIFVSDQLAQKVDALQSGADEFLSKPVYMGELKDRIEMLLNQKHRRGIETGQGSRFFGRLEEMGLPDLLQIIDVSPKEGLLSIDHKGYQGQIWFKNGEILDAKMAHLQGVAAIYRLLTWTFGQYEFDFNAQVPRNQINQPIAQIKAQGMDHVDQWNRMCEQLPSLETIFRIDQASIDDRDEATSPSMQQILHQFDGERTMQEVIDSVRFPDLNILRDLTELYFEGLIYEVRQRLQEDEADRVFVEAGLNTQYDLSPTPTQRPPALDTDGEHEMSYELDDDVPLPPPISDSTETPDLPEEGQELLADLYSSVTQGGLEPPPVPQNMSDDGSSRNEYLKIFGEELDEDEFGDYDDPFFMDGDDSDLSHLDSAESKVPVLFLILLGMAAIGVSIMIIPDRLSAFPRGENIQPDLDWYKRDSRGPLTEFMKPLEQDWKIDSTQEVEPDVQKTEQIKFSKPKKGKGAVKRFKDYFKDAKSLHDQGEYEQALQVVEKAVALNSSSSNALLLAAKVHLELSNNNESIQYLKRLLKLDPKYSNTSIDPTYDSGIIHILLGSAYQEKGVKKKAINQYKEYLKRYPSGSHAEAASQMLSLLKESK